MNVFFRSIMVYMLAGLTLLAAEEYGGTPYRELDFTRGVNLTEWFQYVNSAHAITFGKFSKQDFENMKTLGVSIIRLPIEFTRMTGTAPDYRIDPLLFEFLDQAIDWAEAYKIYIILDNHSSDGSSGATANDIDTFLIPLWIQVAEHYKNRSKYVLYEIMNEPYGGISAARWGKIQGDVINAIRTKDTVHTIVVGGHSWNSIDSLREIPVYTDKNLLYTFHFYDPHPFTHQGADWGEPSLANLRGVPFPAHAHAMPALPKELRGTWVEGNLKNYTHEASLTTLTASIDKAVQFSKSRGVPVFCGEFGVYMKNSLPDDRVRWYEAITKILDDRKIPRTSWDYFGGFGLYKTQQGGDIYSDLNVEVARAMGFTPPAQRAPEKIKAAFYMYDDYAGPGISIRHWGKSVLDLYDTGNTSEGKFAISWKNIGQYDSFYFEFSRGIDWNYLKSNGYALQFKARTEKAVEFDIRFLDSESNAGIPWRIRYSINEKVLPPDGAWHTIRIPLADMKEHGAWVNNPALPGGGTWHNPNGRFSWDAIERLDFAAEERALPGCTIWFDAIQITKQ
ncbi:hypothetical protein FACS189496_0980 [Bacilli bacterium]|nr:hypothetical protein FACS189496_0980 [Bacilli bacterium]